jgi:predicted amidohydrolase YtcJ
MAVGSNSDLEKLAHLLILDRDYLTIPADEIKDIKPLLTMVSGKVVYEVGSK